MVARISLEPLRHVGLEELLAPDHPGERLSLHQPLVLGKRFLQSFVEIVGLPLALRLAVSVDDEFMKAVLEHAGRVVRAK